MTLLKKTWVTGFVAAAALLSTAAAQAADFDATNYSYGAISAAGANPSSPFEIDFGARSYFSTGRYRFTLNDSSNTVMVSRLTWPKLMSASGELYGRAETSDGFFVKGYVGLGDVLRGTLTDEDFPPGITPYSATDSNQRNGHLDYYSADLGYDFWNEAGTRLGGFVGWHYSKDSLNAYGCTQVGDNPGICGVDPVPLSTLALSESEAWSGVRVGVATETAIGDHLELGLEAAYLIGRVAATDTHWLRIGTGSDDFDGPTAISGKASGWLLDANLDYKVTNYFTIGIGGRYWKMMSRAALVGFAQSAVPVGEIADQYGSISSETYGAYLEAALRF